jgi:hypothetical protein
LPDLFHVRIIQILNGLLHFILGLGNHVLQSFNTFGQGGILVGKLEDFGLKLLQFEELIDFIGFLI